MLSGFYKTSMLEVCFGGMLWRHSLHDQLFLSSKKLLENVRNFISLGKSDHSRGAR